MGKTERSSSHFARREFALFGGAGLFSVVVVLFKVESPKRRALQEPHGHCFTSFVILHGNNGCFRRAVITIAFDLYPVIEFQWQARQKNSVFRAAKLHDGSFPQSRAAGPQRGHLHGNPDGQSAREEACESFCATLFGRGKRYFIGTFHVASQPAVTPEFSPKAD